MTICIKVYLVIATTCSLVAGRKLERSSKNVAQISDLIKQTPDFIEKYGYQAESHTVTTDDEYNLIIHRIKRGRNGGDEGSTGRPVVLMQHGILASSDQWVLRGPQDLAFILADRGYDVWLGNTRGSYYSSHKRYKFSDHQFWNYSINELGQYDLSAMVNYILQESGTQNLSYVCHSRGGAMAMILISSMPEYNSKFNLVVGLGPVVYTSHAKSPFFTLFGNQSLVPRERLQKIFLRSRIYSLGITTKEMRRLMNLFCNPQSLLLNMCIGVLFFFSGKDFKMFDMKMMPVILSHFTLGIGVKEGLHFIQIAESDTFKNFDYGVLQNYQHYGSPVPPSYNLSAVTVPVAIFYGGNDLLCSEKDLQRLKRELPNIVQFKKIPYSAWNHVDYMWGKDAGKYLYADVVRTIEKYSPSQISTHRII